MAKTKTNTKEQALLQVNTGIEHDLHYAESTAWRRRQFLNKNEKLYTGSTINILWKKIMIVIFRVVNDSDYGGLECSATNSVGSGGAPCHYRIAQPVRWCSIQIIEDNDGLDWFGLVWPVWFGRGVRQVTSELLRLSGASQVPRLGLAWVGMVWFGLFWLGLACLVWLGVQCAMPVHNCLSGDAWLGWIDVYYGWSFVLECCIFSIQTLS